MSIPNGFRLIRGKSINLFLWFLLASIAFSGCSLLSGDDGQYEKTPIPAPNERNGKPLVMIVGDSIAAGWQRCAPTPCKGIELDWWQSAIGDVAWVFNRGVGNSTTSDLLNRWEQDTQDADIIIIVIGVNDAFRDVPAEDIIKNLESMQQRAREQDVIPIFATILPFNSDEQTPYAAAEAVNDYLLTRDDWLILDLHTAFEDPDNPNHARPDELATDIHPNAQGYARLTEYVREWWAQNFPENLIP